MPKRDNAKGETDFNLRHGNQGPRSQQQLPYIASGFGKTALFELLFRSLYRTWWMGPVFGLQ
jgi:hypothetical protein